jgi:hypothetical protein
MLQIDKPIIIRNVISASVNKNRGGSQKFSLEGYLGFPKIEKCLIC